MKKRCINCLVGILILCASALFISRAESPAGGLGQTASIELGADPTSIPADSSSSSTITATLKDSAGGAVSEGTSVTFSITLATFINSYLNLTWWEE